MADVFVAVPFVKQETLYYCGPATLQMMLSALGVAAPVTPPSWQYQMWAEVMAKTGAMRPSSAPSTPTSGPAYATQKCEWCAGRWKCWATTPGVLQNIINARQGVAKFSITMHVTEKSATGVLLDTLDANLPGAALIRGWQHWLAVDGYRHGQTGSTLVAGRNLNGVFIRDPWVNLTIHYITWSKWKSDYLKFVPCGDYKDTFVVMGGVRIQLRRMAKAPKAPSGIHIIDPLESQLLQLQPVKKLIPDLEAIRYARQAATELSDSVRLRPGFASAQAATALLVQRLDEHDRYYYIVSFTSGDRETARVIVDAHDGQYSEVSAIQETGQALPPYVSRKASAGRLVAEAESLSSAMRYQVRKGTVGEHPVPVWKPCGESSSPFLPFYQYSVGDSFVYYRLDGERFDELTEGPA